MGLTTMLDPALVALANCPVIQQKEEGGHIVFNPYPVISASNDLILSHEICHRLSGPESYNKFVTAVFARKNEAFKFILNLLVDWYDERTNSQYSMYLHRRVEDLRQTVEIPDCLPDSIKTLYKLYRDDIKPSDFPEITGIEDLIVYADKFLEQQCDAACIQIMIQLGKSEFKLPDSAIVFVYGSEEPIEIENRKPKLGATSDISNEKRRGDFYLKTVSKYNNIIDTVSSLWIRNKYKWESAYFGEINWKNLPGLFLGDKLGLPIYRLLHKLDIKRGVHLVIDRSGSTASYSTPIMETAIIITESFRRCNVPVSILSIESCSVVNKLEEPLDFNWFVPLAGGGTPLGKTIDLIRDSQPDDYLLIVTDGEPDSWEQLIGAVQKFRGYDLTFVIGNSFRTYYEKLRGHAVSVEPTTIVRELMNDCTLAS